MKGELAEVIAGTKVYVRNIRLASGSKREPFDQFGKYIKISQFNMAVEDAIVSYGIGIKSFFCIGKGLTQNRSILVPGARTKALGPELKFLFQSCFALKCQHAESTVRYYSHGSCWQQGAVEGLLK